MDLIASAMDMPTPSEVGSGKTGMEVDIRMGGFPAETCQPAAVRVKGSGKISFAGAHREVIDQIQGKTDMRCGQRHDMTTPRSEGKVKQKPSARDTRLCIGLNFPFP